MLAMRSIARPAWAHVPARERSSLLFAEKRPSALRARMKIARKRNLQNCRGRPNNNLRVNYRGRIGPILVSERSELCGPQPPPAEARN